MTEFFQACLAPLNLPFTVLLILLLLYWLIVILGGLDADWAPDFDIDADSILGSLTGFLGIGDAPVMMIMSLLILSLWSISMIFNHWFNASFSLWIGAGLLAANFIISLTVTGLVMRPLGKILGAGAREAHQKIVYRVGRVTTGEINASFGQVEIESEGPPITVNARTTGELVLKKGEKALIYDEDKEKGIYFVEKFEE